VLDAELRRWLEPLRKAQLVRGDFFRLDVRQPLEERLRAFVRGAGQMKPDGHLTFAEGIRLPFAEAQLVLGDLLAAAAAPGPARRGMLDQV
jgi:hypothetical protein